MLMMKYHWNLCIMIGCFSMLICIQEKRGNIPNTMALALAPICQQHTLAGVAAGLQAFGGREVDIFFMVRRSNKRFHDFVVGI